MFDNGLCEQISDQMDRGRDKETIASLTAQLARLTRELEEERNKYELACEAFVRSTRDEFHIRWNPDGFWAYSRITCNRKPIKLSGPCDTALAAAMAATAALTPPKQENDHDA